MLKRLAEATRTRERHADVRRTQTSRTTSDTHAIRRTNARPSRSTGRTGQCGLQTPPHLRHPVLTLPSQNHARCHAHHSSGHSSHGPDAAAVTVGSLAMSGVSTVLNVVSHPRLAQRHADCAPRKESDRRSGKRTHRAALRQGPRERRRISRRERACAARTARGSSGARRRTRRATRETVEA